MREKTAAKFISSGLTKTGKKHKAITHEDGLEIRKRNKWLVELPLPGTRIPILKSQNKFDLPAFLEICNRFRFDSFLKKEELNKWKTFFKGYPNETGKIQFK